VYISHNFLVTILGLRQEVAQMVKRAKTLKQEIRDEYCLDLFLSIKNTRRKSYHESNSETTK
jgi:hypothetical protein